jgi:polyhydroxybutyrate depolymerase
LNHDGVQRTFHVRLPPAFTNANPAPLVLSFHGRAVSAAHEEAVSGFTDLAAEEGFIVVYPEGLGTSQSWNAGVCCGESQAANVDDLGFVDAMLDRLEGDLCIDTSRVYANGLSAGGFFSYALACERTHRFAAMASVAGMTGIIPCQPAAEIPVFHFHGTDDNIVSYTGTAGLSIMSVETNMADWAARNECSAQSTLFLQEGDVTCEVWSGCTNAADVRLCTVAGGGHQWPGGTTIPFFGHNTDVINATEMMWEFFTDHSR